MSLIGLLASTEKMVLDGCPHMRPFQCSRIEGGFPRPKRVQALVSESDRVGSDRQLNSDSLHK